MDAVLKLRSIFLYDTSKISRATIVLIEDVEKNPIVNIFFLIHNFPPEHKIFIKTYNMLLYMAMADKYVCKIASRYVKKWLGYDIKHVRNRQFSRHFGT